MPRLEYWTGMLYPVVHIAVPLPIRLSSLFYIQFKRSSPIKGTIRTLDGTIRDKKINITCKINHFPPLRDMEVVQTCSRRLRGTLSVRNLQTF